MHSSTVKPQFEELSPDKQWDICQRRERAETVTRAIALTLTALISAPVLIPRLNRQMDISLHEGRQFQVFGVTVWESEPALEALGVLPPEALQKVEAGDLIAGYPVTSGYGPRTSPCDGCSSDHKGVDLGTPIGTPIYAPGTQRSRVKVTCWSGDGAGQAADISSPEIPGLAFQVLHLSECSTGLHPGGSVIARTGDTGLGTGPHLDVRQRDAVTDEYQPPQKGWVQWLLTGDRPKTLKEITSPKTVQELVKSFEGFHEMPYWDYQQWTSGYGTPAEHPDEAIDEATAEKRLQEHLDKAASEVDALVTVPLNSKQKDALTSFQYNTGGLAGSTLLKKLNDGDYQGAANEFDQWVHADGQELPGLVDRRAKEKLLFLSP